MTCAWINCDRATRSRGLCPKHYDKTLRAGRRALRRSFTASLEAP